MQIGDKIVFKMSTRKQYKKAIRIINGFDYAGRPTVRFQKWLCYAVEPAKIINVIKKDNKND